MDEWIWGPCNYSGRKFQLHSYIAHTYQTSHMDDKKNSLSVGLLPLLPLIPLKSLLRPPAHYQRWNGMSQIINGAQFWGRNEEGSTSNKNSKLQ